MFDNLRDSASDFYEEEPTDTYKESQSKSAISRRKRKNARLLGMTAQQRFILSTMLFLTVCVMGFLAMFVLGKMSLF
jgi:hypothetical protein